MKLNPQIPLSDKFQARLAAQSIIYHSFNPKRVVAELRPDIKQPYVFFAKLMAEEAVQAEMEKIMSRTERNATKFLKTLWDAIETYESYLTDPTKGEPPKHVVEVAQTAMRLLGKGYINEKKGVNEDDRKPPMVIQGLGDNVANLTGESKKVM